MLHPSTKRLIDKLDEMTAQSRIAWADGENGDVVYDTEGYRVALTGEPVEFVLLDPLGNELERASAADLGAEQTADGGAYSALVEGLRVDARRIARGAEHAISRVLASLERDSDGVDTAEAEDADAALAEVEPEARVEDQADETEVAATVTTRDYAADGAPAQAPPADAIAETEPPAVKADEDAEPVAAPEPAAVETTPVDPPERSEPNNATGYAAFGAAAAGAAAAGAALTDNQGTEAADSVDEGDGQADASEPVTPAGLEPVSAQAAPVFGQTPPADPPADRAESISAAEAELAFSNAETIPDAIPVERKPAEPANPGATTFGTFGAFASTAASNAALSTSGAADAASDTAGETAAVAAETDEDAVAEANESIEGAFNGLQEQAGGLTGQTLEQAGDASATLGDVVSDAGDAGDSALAAAQSSLAGAAETAGGVFEQAAAILQDGAAAAADSASDAVSAAADSVADAGASLAEQGADAVSGTASAATLGLGAATGFAGAAFSSSASFTTRVGQPVAGAAGGAVEKAAETVEKAVEEASENKTPEGDVKPITRFNPWN